MRHIICSAAALALTVCPSAWADPIKIPYSNIHGFPIETDIVESGKTINVIANTEFRIKENNYYLTIKKGGQVMVSTVPATVSARLELEPGAMLGFNLHTLFQKDLLGPGLEIDYSPNMPLMQFSACDNLPRRQPGEPVMLSLSGIMGGDEYSDLNLLGFTYSYFENIDDFALALDGVVTSAALPASDRIETSDIKLSSSRDGVSLDSVKAGNNGRAVWTAEDGDWNLGAKNWQVTDINGDASVKSNFLNGDLVEFQDVGAVGSAAKTINITSAGAYVAGMNISGGSNLAFIGGRISSTDKGNLPGVAAHKTLSIEGNSQAVFKNHVSFDGGEIKGGSTAVFEYDSSFKGGLKVTDGSTLILRGLPQNIVWLAESSVLEVSKPPVFEVDEYLTVDGVINSPDILGPGGLLVIGNELLLDDITLSSEGGDSQFNPNSNIFIVDSSQWETPETRSTVLSGPVSIDGTSRLGTGSGGLINGRLTLGDGATLLLDSMDAALMIKGPIVTEGSLKADLMDGAKFQATRRYALIVGRNQAGWSEFTDKAQQAVNDLFGTGRLAGFAVNSDGNILELRGAQSDNAMSIMGAGYNSNSRAVGQVIDNLPSSHILYQTIAVQDDAVIPRLMSQAAGESTAAIQAQAGNWMTTQGASQARRLNQVQGERFLTGQIAPPTGEGEEPSRLWFSLGRAQRRVDGHNGLAGSRQDLLGANIGYDHKMDDGWLIGLSLGLGRHDLTQIRDYAKSKGTSLSIGAYGSKASPINDKWTHIFSFGVSSAYHNFDNKRRVTGGTINEELTSDQTGRSISFFADSSFNFDLGQSTQLSPYLGLDYQHTSWDAAKEHGGILALSHRSRSDHDFGGSIGLRATHSVSNALSFHADLGWRHSFDRSGASIMTAFQAGGDRFRVQAADDSRNQAIVQVGTSWSPTARTELTLAYDGAYSSDARTHGGSAAVRVLF